MTIKDQKDADAQQLIVDAYKEDLIYLRKKELSLKKEITDVETKIIEVSLKKEKIELAIKEYIHKTR